MSESKCIISSGRISQVSGKKMKSMPIMSGTGNKMEITLSDEPGVFGFFFEVKLVKRKIK